MAGVNTIDSAYAVGDAAAMAPEIATASNTKKRVEHIHRAHDEV